MSSHLTPMVVIMLFIIAISACFAQLTKPLDYSLTTLLGGQIGDGLKATNVGTTPISLAVDKRNGNIYFTDLASHQVKYLDTNGYSHLFAGSPTYSSSSVSDSLTLANASLNQPYGVAVNSKGEVFITDTGTQRVKKVYYNSTIDAYNMITIGGGGLLLTSGISALSALLNNPKGIIVSPNDEIYFCDSNNYMIRKIVNNTMYTVVGTGVDGKSPDGTPATSTQIGLTYSIAFHPVTGELYYAEYLNSMIRYIASNGTVYTYANVVYPYAIAFDSNGDLYVATTSHQVLKVIKNVYAVIANNAAQPGFSGDGGNAVAAKLKSPYGLVVYNNSIYVSDTSNNRIRKIDLTSYNISTIVGDGNARYTAFSGYRSDVSLVSPLSTFYNSKTDELLIADNTQNVVLRLNSVTNYNRSLIENIAGTGTQAFDVDGKLGNQTSLNSPYSVIQSETTGEVFIGTSSTILRLTKDNQIISTFAGSQTMYAGDGYPAIYALVYTPTSITSSPSGEIYFSDSSNNVIRKIDARGIISTVAGDGKGTGYLDGPALSAKFYYPNGLAFLPNGDLIILDYFNNRIRQLSASSGNVTTIAGTYSNGFNGDGILATTASLSTPACVCVNSTNGDIIFTDINTRRIRKIENSTKLMYTLIGTGSSAFTTDGLNGTSTSVTPYGLAIHPISGDLYFTDSSTSANLVRRLDSKDGKVYTVIGGGSAYSKTSFANSTYISAISYITFSPNGDLYLSCPGYSVIKKMDYGSNIVYDVAGSGGNVNTGDGAALSTYLSNPTGLVSTVNGELIFSDAGSSNMIRKLSGGLIRTIAGGNGDGADAKNAYIRIISSMALTDTDLYLSDQANYRIRKVSLSSGIISSVIGTYYYLDNGDKLANQTNINQVYNIRIRNNEIVFTDTNNFKIRKSDISGTGMVTTIAGKGNGLVTSENVPATQAYLNYPKSIAYLPNGELIIADSSNNILRKVDLSGNIALIAGQYFQAGFNGDVSNAKNALLNNPQGLSVLNDGRIIFADTNNIRIRMLTPYCSDGYFITQTSSGIVCQIPSCYGKIYNDSTVCSGKGVCQSYNNCTCMSGYSGSECSTADYCTLYPTSYVCSSSSYSTAETQITKVSNISQLDSKTIQFSSTSTISISLPSIISQYLQSTDTSLKNDSIQVVSSLSNSKTSDTAVISPIVSLVLLKSSSSEKIAVQNLQQSISFSFSNVNLTLPNIESLNISCVYFDENSKEWKSDGMSSDIQNLIIHNLDNGNVTLTLSINCKTNHLTSFSVIDQNYKKATQPNKDDSVILTDYTVLIAAIVGGVGGLCVIVVIVTLIIIAACLLVKRRKK